MISLRGGYGSNYLLDESLALEIGAIAPKCLIGFSDMTSLEIFLWQKLGWTSFYGPMVAAGLDAGAGAAKGYDEASFRNAISKTDGAWSMIVARRRAFVRRGGRRVARRMPDAG